MDKTTFRPRRSVLYMPGANERALDKAKSIPADALIFDLEDAVAPDAKTTARANVTSAVRSKSYGGREIIVRVNALDTPWGEDDLAAVVEAGPDVVLAPKVSRPDDVRELESRLTGYAAGEELSLWVMIETPLAILDVHAIAREAASTRLTGFVLGTNDLAKDLRAVMTEDRMAFLPALGLTLAAARAYGLVAIDGVYNDIKNNAGFERECVHGQALGFDGKTLIHPTQVETCNRVFSPAPEEIEHSRAVIAAFADPQNAGQGVIKVNGKMTEILHLENAKRIVSMADAIAGRMQSEA